MSVVLFDLAEGMTLPLEAQLLLDGSPFDGTGMTVAAVLRDKSGSLVTLAADWSTTRRSVSVVTLAPVTATWRAAHAPYAIRFQVTDAAGKLASFPPGTPAVVLVSAV